jgi:2-amino-4-hydroxy-6-hydroxymethyldihydropteridine diphosphokinase
MPEVFVGLGSNIEPETNLRWALAELAQRFGRLECSQAYRSPAFGFEGPEFLNLVVGFRSDLVADEVEAVLSELENSRGRDITSRAGSRTLDLDLLLHGHSVDARRRLPRIDVLCYPFVLAPLAEIAPGLRHPVTGITMDAAWSRVRPGHPELVMLGMLVAA